MCKRRIILALETAGRYIAQCEHGTVHIVWDNLTIRFQPADFARFAGIVEDAYIYMLSRSGTSNKFHLLIQGVGLSFSPDDLVLLQELTCVAAMQMNSQSTADEAALLEVPPIGPVSFPAGLLPYSLN